MKTAINKRIITFIAMIALLLSALTALFISPVRAVESDKFVKITALNSPGQNAPFVKQFYYNSHDITESDFTSLKVKYTRYGTANVSGIYDFIYLNQGFLGLQKITHINLVSFHFYVTEQAFNNYFIDRDFISLSFSTDNKYIYPVQDYSTTYTDIYFNYEFMFEDFEEPAPVLEGGEKSKIPWVDNIGENISNVGKDITSFLGISELWEKAKFTVFIVFVIGSIFVVIWLYRFLIKRSKK